jgi:hypothetical protein
MRARDLRAKPSGWLVKREAKRITRTQMLTFSLDTNCIIDIEEERPDSVFVRALAGAHACGEANAAVVAISASEKQKKGKRHEL